MLSVKHVGCLFMLAGVAIIAAIVVLLNLGRLIPLSPSQ